MSDYTAVLLAAEVLLAVAIIILRDPKLLIPAVVIGLPIEVVESELVAHVGTTGVAGMARAFANPGQLAMLAVIGVAIVRKRHDLTSLVPNSSLLVPFAAFFGLVFLSVTWSDSLRPNNSVLILPVYLAFLVTAPSLIETRHDVERILGTFLAVAGALAVIAVAQRLFGVFNWRGILIQSDDYSYRSNATFADPNVLARFLAITMALAAGLVLSTGPRRQTVYLALPAFALGAAGIVATASRSGWMLLLLCGFIMVLASPIRRYTKFMLTGSAVSFLVIMLALLFAQGGTDAERVKSLSTGVQVLGQRQFLIQAAWAMFKDNPWVGVGSGNYQHSLIMNYQAIVPDWSPTSLSHTSMATLLAELGLVGVVMFGFLVARVGIAVFSAYWATQDRYTRLVVGWLGTSMFGIVLHSQSEGRLFEEPFLWVLLAIFIAMETTPALSPRTPRERAATAAAANREPARATAGGGTPAPTPAFSASTGEQPAG
ncbi:MAG: O-antigen ligase family protein [Dehalococcoidia bacterium]